MLDCRKFKQQAIEGIKSLLDQLREHLLSGYITIVKEQTAKNEATWKKIKAVHVDIDATIEQIDYCNMMMQDDVYDEMVGLVRYASTRKKFLDLLMISIPEEVFQEFLTLHSFPVDMREALEKKIRILKAEQKKIKKLITD